MWFGMRCEIEEQVKWEAKKEETKRIRKKEKKNEAQERKSGEPKSPIQARSHQRR